MVEEIESCPYHQMAQFSSMNYGFKSSSYLQPLYSRIKNKLPGLHHEGKEQ